jgi:hypothetical protein
MKKTDYQQAVVTIVDPRHPLYGNTFPLLKVISSKSKQTCLVEIESGLNRHIPLEVTDRCSTPARINQVPIDIESLTKLCDLYYLVVGDAEQSARPMKPVKSRSRARPAKITTGKRG